MEKGHDILPFEPPSPAHVDYWEGDVREHRSYVRDLILEHVTNPHAADVHTRLMPRQEIPLEMSRDREFVRLNTRNFDHLSDRDIRMLQREIEQESVTMVYTPYAEIPIQVLQRDALFGNALIIDDAYAKVCDRGKKYDTEAGSIAHVWENGKSATYTLPENRSIIGHHSREHPREQQRASCLQFCEMLATEGAFSAFLGGRGKRHLHMNIWFDKRPDEDVALTYVLARYFSALIEFHRGDRKKVRAAFAPGTNAHRIAQAEGLMDACAGGVPLKKLPTEGRKILKYLFAPLAPVKSGFLTMDPETMQRAFDAMYQRFLYCVHSEKADDQVLQNVIRKHVPRPDWVLIQEAGPDARPEIREKYPFAVFNGPAVQGGMIRTYADWTGASQHDHSMFTGAINVAEYLLGKSPHLPSSAVVAGMVDVSRAKLMDHFSGKPWDGEAVGGCIPCGSVIPDEKFIPVGDAAVSLMRSEEPTPTGYKMRKRKVI